ncbi:MAG TPA: GyrI-like domain-containing protein [Propionicimonas sp.]|uniref:GyrI-like domain-containing protein n=1 Tax=Propionicimonas sp. TaxID=1955623 RepID=UPI002F3EDDCE
MSGLNPHLETIEPWVSAGIRRLVPMSTLQGAFPAAFEEVVTKVTEAGGKAVGPAYARYFGMPADAVDVEIGFGIDRPVAAGDLEVTENPAVEAAIGTHVGPYELLEKSYAEMMPWLAQQHLKLADSMLEFYDSPPDVDPAQTVTRMVFPLA